MLKLKIMVIVAQLLLVYMPSVYRKYFFRYYTQIVNNYSLTMNLIFKAMVMRKRSYFTKITTRKPR